MTTIAKKTMAPQQTELDTFLEAIDYRVARSREDLENSFTLVYREYLKRGYVKESDSKLKLSIYNALPSTTTFVAMLEKEVIATTTLIPDSPLGLPMDTLYHEELNVLRQQNKKICEISMLASNTELFTSGTSMLLNSKKMMLIFYLFKVIFDYAKDMVKLDHICITINPKHSLTYDFLLFKDLGGLKTYRNANGAPAIAKHIDITMAEQECRQKNKEGLLEMFFFKKTNMEKLAGRITLNPQDLTYFFVEKTDIFKAAPLLQLGYIKDCYPGYDFGVILD